MRCQFCDQELPDGANYCYKCRKQIVCLGCGAQLFDSASICVYCGREVGSRNISSGMNNIHYKESADGKSFEASFSDETAENVASIFARFVRNGMETAGKPLVLPDSHDNYDIQNSVENISDNDQEPHDALNRIFRERDGKVSLVEKRTKAKNKTDQQARVSMLFLLYMKKCMHKTTTRDVLYDFLKTEKLYDGTYRAWLSQHSSYFLREDDNIELSSEGEEIANAYLNQVFDDSIESVWKSGSHNTSVSKSKVNSIKKSQPRFIDDLNLSPVGKESLANFIKRYNYRKSASQQNLLFVYYLKQVLGISNVTQDHVFTCYRNLGVKLPTDLYHSLSDTISKNHWLLNMSDLNLTSKGLNYVEQNMLRK